MCDGSPPQHMTAQVVNSGEENNSNWMCLFSVPSYPLKDRRVPINKKYHDASRPELGTGYWDIGNIQSIWAVWSKSPLPPFTKGGFTFIPLLQRGKEGDFLFSLHSDT